MQCGGPAPAYHGIQGSSVDNGPHRNSNFEQTALIPIHVVTKILSPHPGERLTRKWPAPRGVHASRPSASSSAVASVDDGPACGNAGGEKGGGQGAAKRVKGGGGTKGNERGRVPRCSEKRPRTHRRRQRVHQLPYAEGVGEIGRRILDDPGSQEGGETRLAPPTSTGLRESGVAGHSTREVGGAVKLGNVGGKRAGVRRRRLGSVFRLHGTSANQLFCGSQTTQTV